MIKDAFDVIDAMSAITRYSQAHNNTRESVLEHTGFVAIFGAAICARIGHDPSEVLKRAIVHDVDEIITGDIPTTTKYANPDLTAELKIVERKGAKQAIRRLLHDGYFKYWEDAKDDTIDGHIIAIADSAAVVFKMAQEAQLGNKSLLRYRQRVRIVFLEMMELDHYRSNGLFEVVEEIADILENIK